MERMRKMFESMLGGMNEKEKERIMEQCLLLMRGCFAEKGKEDKEGKDAKTESAKCCS